MDKSIIEAVHDSVDELRSSVAVSAWISVDERYPEHEVEVLLYPDFGGDCVVGYWYSPTKSFWDNDGRRYVHPLMWLPIPKPPA